MTAKSDLICFGDIRRHAVRQLMRKRTPAGWTDRQVEEELERVELRVRESLFPTLQKALSNKSDLIDENVGMAVGSALHSQQTLRFKLEKHLGERNPDAEKIFEKTLANEEETANEKWANQIPIWSGIRRKERDRSCNIDIGYSEKEGSFRLYELKIDSNTPLYAIMELVTYILGYLIARKLMDLLPLEEKRKIREERRSLIGAQSIEWCVIAPKEYYVKKEQGGVLLSTADLEQVRRVAQNRMEKTAKELGFEDLHMNLTLRWLACEKPSKGQDRKKWISEVRERTSLRTLILQAQPLSVI